MDDPEADGGVAGGVTRFTNARVLRGGRLEAGDVWCEGGLVIDGCARFFEAGRSGSPAAECVVDCGGRVVCAGFVDAQINGAVGVDFSRLTAGREAEEVDRVARHLVRDGVTAFCPTLVTAPPGDYRASAPFLAPRRGSAARGAEMLGAHLEGPFIARGKRGAHREDLVRDALPGGIAAMREVYGDEMLGHARVVTLAPELPGAEDAARELVRRGVVVSAGHSAASAEDALRMVGAGCTMLTHLFNAMGPFHHRDPGIVGLVAASVPLTGRPISYGLIVDGEHSHAAGVRMAYQCNRRGCVLVTDAVPAMGLGPGTHRLGRQEVTVAGGRATIAGCDGVLAGSIATMQEVVRLFMEFTGCSLADALCCATLHPAEALGVADRKGTLEVGADADLVILDETARVARTYIGGRLAWSRDDEDVEP